VNLLPLERNWEAMDYDRERRVGGLQHKLITTRCGRSFGARRHRR
jgi:hypothetical protein